MKTKYFSFVVMILMLIALGACKKDQSEVSHLNNETSDVMLSFKNMEEYTNALKEVLSFNEVDRKAWVQERGFQSYGIKCDEIYSSINPENFRSSDEIKSYVLKNSEFLQIVKDSDGEYSVENKLCSNANRYFSNMDRLFIIGSSVYKVLENGLVYTDAKQIETLKAINETNYTNYFHDSSIHFSINGLLKSTYETDDVGYNCGTSKEVTVTNGSDRTTLSIKIEETDQAGTPQTVLYCTYLVKPQKKTLGVWFACSRTLSANLKVRIDHMAWGGVPAGNWLNEIYTYYEPGNLTTKLEGVFLLLYQSAEGGYVPHTAHFGGYDCWGDTPSTPTAVIKYNESVFFIK